MRLVTILAVFLGLTLIIGRIATHHEVDTVNTNAKRVPVIVELFTSEGCSSCPPADALLAKLDAEQPVGGAEVIALEEHVDYWNHLGWNDPFSSPEWTDRQQGYSETSGHGNVYTPQMVVNGVKEFVGSRERQAREAIAESAQGPKAEITVHLSRDDAGGDANAEVTAALPPPSVQGEQVELWIAVTETGLHSDVKSGENSGEDLHHAAVVRSLRKFGPAAKIGATELRGESRVKLDGNWKRENIRVVVFAQDRKSRRILGATAVKSPVN